MPKEITHWAIASRVLDHMPDIPLKQSLIQHKSLYLLGAVLPDSPYYLQNKAYKDRLQKLSSQLHGENGEDTYLLFKKLFLQKGQAISPDEMALACGFLTHIQADAHIHPLVYYFCGLGHPADTGSVHSSQKRHYYFETLLDIHNWKGLDRAYRHSLRRIVARSPRSLKEISRLIAGFILDDATQYKLAQKMLRSHIRIQSWFKRAFFRILLCLLPGAGLSRNLFYPVIRREIPFFEMPVRYRHPRSGEWHEDSYDALEKRAVNTLVQLFIEIDDHMSRGDIFPLFAGRVGPSLSNGQPHTLNSEMKYFDTSLPIKKLLMQYRGSPSIF